MCMYACMYVSLYLSMNAFTNTMLIILICICMYVWVSVWDVVVYGRWQGRIHYSSVREGFLTSSVAWISIPLSKSRVTVLAWPSKAAMWRALRPHYNRDTQTDRQTQVSDTGTHRQTAHAKGPSPSPSTNRQENTHICMYVCMYYKYMYVNMNGKRNVYKWMHLRILCK